MYVIIRLGLSAVVIWAAVRLLRLIPWRVAKAALIALTIPVLALVTVIPVENCFYSFDSPEAVFQYVYRQYIFFGTGRLDCIVPGEDSAMIFGTVRGTSNVLVAPKGDRGWKIGTGISLKTSSEILDDEVFLITYSYPGTADTYVEVIVHGDQPSAVSDNCGSKFFFVDSNKAKTFFSYCAWVPAELKDYVMLKDYVITIDGKEYPRTGDGAQ